MTSRLSKQGRKMDVTPAGPALPGITHHHAEVNGTRLHYVAAGASGSPVLLFRGFPETWWSFRKLIPLLAASHRVFAVDLRGFGDSGNESGEYDSTTSGEDLYLLIRKLDAVPVHLSSAGRAQPHRHRDGPARVRPGDAGRRHPRGQLAYRRSRRARHPGNAARRPRARVPGTIRVPG